MGLSTRCVAVVLLAFIPLSAAARPTEAEKAKKTAEKKLDAFEKSYDPSKDLSRKNPEKLTKDVAELDEALAALSAVDAAAAQELTARRDALVNQTRQAVGGAVSGKNDEVFNKHFAKLQEQFDPEKRRLESVDASALKRARDEVDRDIAKFEGAARKPYEEKRDAFFATLQANISKAKQTKLRSELTAAVPDLAPSPGAERVAPMPPTWCEGVEAALAQTYDNYHVPSLSMSPDTSPPQALVNVVTFSCFDPEFDVRQRWVAWFRQGLANTYGLEPVASARLLKLAAKLAIAGDVEAQRKATCAQFEPLKTGPAEARYSRRLERTALGCSTPASDDERLSPSVIDVPHGLSSQLAAAALSSQLVTQGFHSNDGKLTGFAIANAVVTLDTAAFEQELAGWKLNEVGVITATLNFYAVVQVIKRLEPEARARNASVLIDAPKKGAQAFAASLASTQAAIDVALALEDQKRTGTLKGCAQSLYGEVAAAAKGQRAPLDELRLDGLLAYKLTFCGRNDPDAPVMERVFGYYAERSVPVRGPFTAAYLALIEAYNAQGQSGSKAGFDATAKRGGGGPDSNDPYVPGRSPIPPPALEHNNTINPAMLATGVVKSVENQGALTKISFRTEHYRVPVLECHETNKIDRITDDGTILYRSNCKKVGEKEETSTNGPITVPTYAAHGVSAGSLLRYESAYVNDDVKGQPHRGWVVEAWDSSERKARTSLFGVAQ